MVMIGKTILRRNDVTALLLVAVVSLAPIPLGSNRPGLWAITDLLVALVFLAQATMRFYDRDERAKFLPGDMPVLVMFTLVIAWHIVQLLPLGSILPGPETGVAGFGETISLVPGQTLLMLLNFVSYGVVFILAFQIGQRPGRSVRLFTYAGLMIGAFGLYALYNFSAQDNSLLGLPREFYIGDAAGTFVNRNNFASFLGVGLLINAGLVAQAVFGASQEGRRVDVGAVLLHTLVAAVLLAALLATHSRMGLFSSLIGAIFTLVLYALFSGGSVRMRSGIIGLVVIGALAIALLYGQGLIERLGSTQSNLDVRMALYAQVRELVLIRPLTGFGAGGFEAAFPLIHHLPVSPDLVWDKAHNTYLTLFAELGLIIGLVPIAMIGWLCFRMAGALGMGTLPRLGAAIALGATVQLGLHALVDFSLEIHAVALLYAFVLGLGMAAAEARQYK